MTHPGYWQMLTAEKWPMRLVIGVGLLIAGSHGLNIAYLLFLGVTGEGWYTEALMYSLVWVWLISAWIGRRYWHRRALAAEGLLNFEDLYVDTAQVQRQIAQGRWP